MKHACLLIWGAWCFGVASTATQAQNNPDRQYLPQEARGWGIHNPSYVVDFDVRRASPIGSIMDLSSTEAQGPCLARTRFVRIPGCLRVQARRHTRVQGTTVATSSPRRPNDPIGRGNAGVILFDDQHGAPDTQLESRNLERTRGGRSRLGVDLRRGARDVVAPAGRPTTMLASGVRVPTTFWKAVMRTSPDTACVAFVFPNADKVPVNSRIPRSHRGCLGVVHRFWTDVSYVPRRDGGTRGILRRPCGRC